MLDTLGKKTTERAGDTSGKSIIYNQRGGIIGSTHHAVFLGRFGQSCNAVCAEENNLKCDPEKLAELNNCKTLKDHFGCEHCEENEGDDQPCLNDAGVCMVKTNRLDFSCSGTFRTTRRLCFCAK